MTKREYVRESIEAWMKARNKKPADMARLIGVSVPTWYRKMQHPERLTMQELEMFERITKVKFLEGGNNAN